MYNNTTTNTKNHTPQHTWHTIETQQQQRGGKYKKHKQQNVKKMCDD